MTQTVVANPSPLTGSQRVALLNKADRNSKIAVRDALYAFFERYLDPAPT